MAPARRQRQIEPGFAQLRGSIYRDTNLGPQQFTLQITGHLAD